MFFSMKPCVFVCPLPMHPFNGKVGDGVLCFIAAQWHSDCEVVLCKKLQLTVMLGLVFLWQVYRDLCVNSGKYMPQNENIRWWPRDCSDKGKGRCSVACVTGDSSLLYLGVKCPVTAGGVLCEVDAAAVWSTDRTVPL